MQAKEARPAFVVIGDSIAAGVAPALGAENKGIGGQTTDEIRKRWRRDTEGATRVYLHAGINDLAQDRRNIRRNLIWFAKDAERRGLELWIGNIGPDRGAWMTPAKEAEARAINHWLATDFQARFPSLVVVDYLGWASEGTGDFNRLRSGAFADDVHPNPAGRSLYAEVVTAQITSRRRQRQTG